MSTKTHPKSEDLGSSVIDAANNLVAQITELVGPAPALSANDVRRSLKLRKGGASIIPIVADHLAVGKARLSPGISLIEITPAR